MLVSAYGPGSEKVETERDFNVHHELWLSSSFTDQPGEQNLNFDISHDLEQLVQFHTRIPDCLGDMPNILDLFSQLPTLQLKRSFSLC